MKKFVFLFILLAVFGSAAAQTCDCGDLQAQVDELSIQVQTLIDMIDTIDISSLYKGAERTIIDLEPFEDISFNNCAVSIHTKITLVKSNTGQYILEVPLIFQNTSETETIQIASKGRIIAFQYGTSLLQGKNHGYTHYLRPGEKTGFHVSFLLLSAEKPIELEFIPARSDAASEIRIINLQ